VLKDDKVLGDYVRKDGETIHMMKQAAAVDKSKSSDTGKPTAPAKAVPIAAGVTPFHPSSRLRHSLSPLPLSPSATSDERNKHSDLLSF